MQNDATNNAASSDTTSPDNLDPLARESVLARVAILRQIEEIKTRIDESTSLSGVVGRHPWLTLTAASAVGFLAAGAVLSPRRSQGAPVVQQDVASTGKPSAASHWWLPLVTPSFEVMKVVVDRLLTHCLSRAAVPPSASPAKTDAPTAVHSNGQPQPEPAKR